MPAGKFTIKDNPYSTTPTTEDLFGFLPDTSLFPWVVEGGLEESLVNPEDVIPVGALKKALIWGLPTTAGWAKALPKYKAIAKEVEKRFPRIAAATKETPVKLYEELSSNPNRLAEYLSASPMRPKGTINLYGARDEWAPVHEMSHRLYEADPVARSIGYDMFLAAPTGVEKEIAKRTIPRNITPEYFAYSLEDLIRESIGSTKQISITGSTIKVPKEMKGKILEFLESTPKENKEEVLEAITGTLFKEVRPVGKQAVKASKEAKKDEEIRQLIKEEIGRIIQKGSKGHITSKRGGGMIVNKEEKLSDYLSELPKPTNYGPKGERIWEF